MKRRKFSEIDVDDIILDSVNLPNFESTALEGRLANNLSKTGAALLGIFIMLVFITYTYKSFELQVLKNEEYTSKALSNTLNRKILIPKRGVIFDRYGKILAQNDKEIRLNLQTDDVYKIYKRKYTTLNGMSHVLGYIKYPQTDSKGVLWRNNYEGVGGVEQYFNNFLNGKEGWVIFSENARRESVSGMKLKEPVDGKNLYLSIDAELSDKLYEVIKKGVIQSGYKGGAGVIMDINTGEVLALVSYPEFDLNKIMESTEYFNEIVKNEQKPLLDRVVSGEYVPGSIVKPAVAISALKEKVVSPEKKILSTGQIKVVSENDPDVFYTFKDWKAHGWVDMKEAIAHSSDVYFYEVGGGYKELVGLGIGRIKKYMRLFGFGEKTGISLPGESSGVVPDPSWKLERFGEKWYLGNTYHTAIGQYGFLVTPIQAVRYIAAIANYGKLIQPVLLKDTAGRYAKLPFTEDEYNVIHDGMRMTTTIGTARALNIPGIEIASKTGTAELGVNKQYRNSWVVGFWPYKKPRYAFAVVLENAKISDHFQGATPAMRDFFTWLVDTYPEYANGKYPEK